MKNSPFLEIYLEEYRKLKDEQISRIGFRDNLIYATLTIFGAIISFIAVNPMSYLPLLIIPWVCFILGWTYLINDDKISAIGIYISTVLSQKIKGSTEFNDIFEWEKFHISTEGRKRKKFLQLIIDISTFCLPGTVSIVAFDILSKNDVKYIYILMILEIIFMTYIFIEFTLQANLKSSKLNP